MTNPTTDTKNKNNDKDKETFDNQRDGRRGIQFPWKLHELLEQTEKNGNSGVISWLPGGKAFKVHKKEEFCNDVMPGFFNSSKYKTFQRSLNLWGFESVVRGPDKGACYHSSFVRGHPELCKNMTRVKIKGGTPELATTTANKITGVVVHQQQQAPAYSAPKLPKLPTMGALAQPPNRPAISDFLRSKSTGARSSDAAMEAALVRRLSAPPMNSLSLPGLSAFSSGLSSGLMGSYPTSSLGGGLLADSRYGFGAHNQSLLPSSSTSRLLSAINTAAAALDVIRQEEAEILRRAQV